VGRRRELAAPRAGAEALRQGGGAVVWVEGEPGIGKSSLVAEELAEDLPKALEDLAAVLAKRGQDDDARAALNEAVSLYEGTGARWDIRRADSRLRAYGVRRGARPRCGPRRTPAGTRSRRPS
jgi:adenylylsulfate kinase-like enzyme